MAQNRGCLLLASRTAQIKIIDRPLELALDDGCVAAFSEYTLIVTAPLVTWSEGSIRTYITYVNV